MKNIFFILMCFSIFSCNGQDSKNTNIKSNSNNKMREKIDINKLDKYATKTPIGLNNYTYEYIDTLENGTRVKIDGSITEGGFVESDILPKPSFLTIYKEFYPSNYIKKKETLIGENVKIGISEYYDEVGNKKEINEDAKFGKIKPQDVLKFLEKKKIINLSTGKGRFDEDGRPTFEIEFDDSKKEYFITIIKGKPNTGPFDNIGEPSAFIPIVYKMDGETGKVEEVK